VLERILELRFGAGSWYYPGREDESGIDERIPIFKLHGSINWMEARGPVSNWSAERLDVPDQILGPQEMSLSHAKSRGCYFVQGQQKYTPSFAS
jgi:hypothetical protein